MNSFDTAVRAVSFGLLAATCPSGAAATPVAVHPGEYDLTTQTVLPHLEEALRYASTRTRQCLREPEASSIFPLLQHPAFSGCALAPEPAAGDEMRFTLKCSNPAAASGSAAIQGSAKHVSAVIELKIGGKNMTLSQRVHGPRIGPCSGIGAK